MGPDNGIGQSLSHIRANIVGIDTRVPLLDGRLATYINLDNAASTPSFRSVKITLDEFLPWYSSVHRGAGMKSLVSTDLYEKAHQAVLRFVGADPNHDVVVFGKNTTEAINILASRFEFNPGDVVITTGMEHHSNDLPWRPRAQVIYSALLPDGSLDMHDLERVIAQHNKKLRLVSVTGASNVTGFINPIHAVAELAHAHGAMILVDCAQLAPHRSVDMKKEGAADHLDFVTLSAHKMYAPFGTGALIGPRAFFSNGSPSFRGGGTVNVVSLEEVFWANPPDKDEAGSPNVIGAVALAASIATLEAITLDVIAEHEARLTAHALRRLSAIPGVRLFGSSDPDRSHDRLGVISFEVEGVPHAKVAAVLSFEAAIGVRSGCFCAHPYVLKLMSVGDVQYQRFKAAALRHDRSDIPGLVRASFGCYNTEDEIDALAEMVERVAQGDYRGRYFVQRETGSYYPREFDFSSITRRFDFVRAASAGVALGCPPPREKYR